MELVTLPINVYYERCRGIGVTGGLAWLKVVTHLSMSHAKIDDCPTDEPRIELAKLLQVKTTQSWRSGVQLPSHPEIIPRVSRRPVT